MTAPMAAPMPAPMPGRITRFTIVGGGAAGWLAAGLIGAVLNRRRESPDVAIELIESPSVSTIGVGEATTLSIYQTFGQMALDEDDFLKKCDATFKCAVRFDAWDVAPDGSPRSYYHPFAIPRPLHGISPAYHYLHWRNAGKPTVPFAEAMCVSPALMDADRAPRSLDAGPYGGSINYSYHLDAGRLGPYLKDFCVTMGVDYISDDVDGIERAEDGFISALNLRERGRHEVEFVIDCSGFRSLVLQQAMEEPFISYADALLCDRALASPVAYGPGERLPSYTTSTALGAGWSWAVPLQSRRGTGYVFSSAFRSDDEAIEEYRRFLGPVGAGVEPAVIPMKIGRARRSWVKNCLGVGLAAGFIEPLESTSIHFIQVSIRRFLDNLPDRSCDPALADQYNRLTAGMYEDIRDFIALHYALSNRQGPFWEAARQDATVPQTVKDRIALWRRKLPTALDIATVNPLFSEWSYLYVLFGKGFYDGVELPMEESVSDEDFLEFQAELNRRKADALGALPGHRAFFEALSQRETTPWYG